MKDLLVTAVIALLAVSGAKGQDSLSTSIQAGDSCMRHYNTFEALQHYQRACSRFAQAQSVPYDIRMRLADCYYHRAKYGETTELLKKIPEDSLTHDAFRQLVQAYQRQGDGDAYVYWAGRFVRRYPMDAEIVSGLTLGHIRNEMPQYGIKVAERYTAVDSTNVLVNRALADAYFIDRQFGKAAMQYERLLQQGDSTFNTLYSAGMSYARIDSLERAYSSLATALMLSGMTHYGCAYRLGVVCVDTERYEEGLGYLTLALALTERDSTMMRALTLSEGEAHYRLEHYAEAVEAWKRHLEYNPSSVATYYNIANTSAYLLNDDEQARSYFREFLGLARSEKSPTPQLDEMMKRAEALLKYYDGKKPRR